MRTRSLLAKVTLGYLVCIALAIVGSTSVYRALNQSQAAEAQLATVGKFVSAGGRLSGAVLDAATGERGFAVTGAPASLDLYTAGVGSYDAAVADLRPLLWSPEQRAQLARMQVLFSQWQTQVAGPEIAARRAAPAGLATATQTAYATVLGLRKVAAEDAAAPSPSTLQSWAIEVEALRQQLTAVTTLEPSPQGLAALQQAFALVAEAEQLGPGAPGRLVAIADRLDGILSARVKVSAANESQLQQLLGPSTTRSSIDQVRSMTEAFDALGQTRLSQELSLSGSAVYQAKLVAVVAPIVLILLLVFALILSRRLVASVREVSEASSALAAGDFTRRVRTRGDDEVAVMARAYNAMADRVRAQTDEAARLRQMSDLLQSSLSLGEATEIIGRIAAQLFPDRVGGVYLITASRDQLERVTAWGADAPGLVPAAFAPDACWALRRGRAHRSDEARCRHLPDPPSGASLCVPLVAQGDAIGVLLIAAPPASAAPTLSARDIELATTVAGQIGLALGNLRLRETLRGQSIRDALTGLYNRRYLEETLPRELQRSARTGQPLSVIMFDIDLFKRFNDTFGHDAGDLMLREVGTLLRTQLRAEDVACRYGGEEFVVILAGAPLETALERARTLSEAMRHTALRDRGQPLGAVTLSAGVAAFPAHGDTGDALLRSADAALYHAKQNGRDRVEVAAAA